MYIARFTTWQKTINKLFSQPTGKFTFDDIVTIIGRQRFIDYIRKNHPYLIEENGVAVLLENKPVYHDKKPVPESFFNVIYDEIEKYLTRHRLKKMGYIPELLNLYHRTKYRKTSTFPTTKALVHFVELSYPATNYIASTFNDATSFIFVGKEYMVIGKPYNKHYYFSVIDLGTLLKDFILLRDISEVSTLPSIAEPFKAKSIARHANYNVGGPLPFPHMLIKTTALKDNYFKVGARNEILTHDLWKILVSDAVRWVKINKPTS